MSAGSGALATYTYDGFGQRLIKTVSASYGEIYQNGQNGALLEETNSSGVAQADYIYLNGRLIATLNNVSGALYFLHDDLLGTPQVASDGSQKIQWQASYQPFGQTSSVSGTITQNLRLPGQYYDVESGWNHNGFRDYVPQLGRYIEPDPLGMQGSARFYNPTTGRFLSGDPLGFLRSGPDLYAYAYDSPLTFVDPSGLTVSCTYAQNTGGLVCFDDGTGQQVVNTTGYAGGNEGLNPQGVNNSSYQSTPDVGPLPEGGYNIGTDNGRMGPLSLPLTPWLGNSMFGRGGFYIHGNNSHKPPLSSSEGCIVIDRNARQTINDSGGGTLYVTNTDTPNPWSICVNGVCSL